MKHEHRLKAYVVTETEEGTGGVVFARFNAEARRIGAGKYSAGEWEYVECRRASNFDCFAPGPVPVAAMLAAGWWWPCGHCGRHLVDGDSPIIDEALKTVWCNPWHRLREAESIGKHEATKKLAIIMARQSLPRGCVVHTGIVEDTRFKVLAAYFDFPGAILRTSKWRSDSPGTVEVSRMDLRAWQDFRAGIESHRWEDDGGSVAA